MPQSHESFENDRLAALRSYNILDSPAESVFDSLTDLARTVCRTPMAALTFVDERRQWFKSHMGLNISETPRQIAFCAYTIQGNAIFEVEDAERDPRFQQNPLVRNDPHIRFYAGAPLLAKNNLGIGSLAVMDCVARRLTLDQREALSQMARHAILQLELRRVSWDFSERYRVLTEASPLPIVILDRNFKVAVWNRAAEQTFGFISEEVLGKENPIVPLADRGEYRDLLNKVFEGEQIVQAEGRRQKRDGSLVDVYLYAAPLRNDAGEITGAMAMLQDISAFRHSQEQLECSVSLLNATLESTADGILVVDRKGKIVARNARFVDIWRLPAEALSRERDADAISAALKQVKNPGAFLSKVNDLYSKPDQDSFDVVELVDGRILERYSQPQRSGQQIVGRVWSFRDVSDRVELENHLRQSHKMEAIGALAGGVAHDFNNLLNVIIGYSSLISAGLAPDSAASQHADKVLQAAQRAAGLTRQLLAFSRRQVLRPQTININELVTGLTQMLPRLLPEDIELRVALANEPLYVRADPGQLEQVLMNLAVNARDAMPRGGELRISILHMASQDPGANAYVQLSVEDTGEGIEPAIQARIFEPFFTTKPPGRGTGLGLSTAYGIIHQSGGTIQVDSRIGEGSRFRIKLPLAEPPTIAPKLIASADQSSAEAAEHILVVEDDLALRSLVAHILRAVGYRVAEALSPEYALQTIAQPDIRIDLLLTDVVMPRISGGELATRARKIRPNLKLALMSGYPEEDIQEKCGDVTLIEKPFTPEALLEHVRFVLRSTEEDVA